jgi:hypothetical protein
LDSYLTMFDDAAETHVLHVHFEGLPLARLLEFEEESRVHERSVRRVLWLEWSSEIKDTITIQ